MLDHSVRVRVTRRQFGLLAGAAGVALGAGGLPSLALAQGTPDSATIIKGKKAGLRVLNAKLGVMETPLAELRQHEITPKDIVCTTRTRAMRPGTPQRRRRRTIW
jgi:hypothetical protein